MHLRELDQWAQGVSWLHTWDPRIKLVSLSALLVVVVILPTLPAAAGGLIAALVLLRLARIPFPFVAVHLRRALLFIGLLAAVLAVTVPGRPLLQCWSWTISREGVYLGLLVLVRSVSALLLIFPMIGTQRFDTTLHSLQSLHVPSTLVQLLLFSYRYLFLFLDEVSRLFTAAHSRGWCARLRLSALATWGNLLGMLLVRGFERTERIRTAMLSRGYRGQVQVLDHFQTGTPDYLKAGAVAALAVALVLLGWVL
jgi:cobalt/nickel transport system permease protein